MKPSDNILNIVCFKRRECWEYSSYMGSGASMATSMINAGPTQSSSFFSVLSISPSPHVVVCPVRCASSHVFIMLVCPSLLLLMLLSPLSIVPCTLNVLSCHVHCSFSSCHCLPCTTQLCNKNVDREYTVHAPCIHGFVHRRACTVQGKNCFA